MKLNRLEHLLLSSMCNDREPLHALYSDTVRDMPEVEVKQVIDGLLRLTSLGLARGYFYTEKKRRYEPSASLTREELQAHVAGRTKQELGNWPSESLGGEYFFEITEKGRKEEAKDIYSPYYRDPAAAEG